VYSKTWLRWREKARKGSIPRRRRQQPYAFSVVKRGSIYVPIDKPSKPDEEVHRVVIPHDERQLSILLSRNRRSMGRNLWVHVSKNMGATQRIVRWIWAVCPQAKISVCLYCWKHRICARYQDILRVILLLPGGLKLWTNQVYDYVKYWLNSEKDSLGTICRKLNMFGIWISVNGLLHWRFKHIKPPPPVFVW
jgi:hypothetical protein